MFLAVLSAGVALTVAEYALAPAELVACTANW